MNRRSSVGLFPCAVATPPYDKERNNAAKMGTLARRHTPCTVPVAFIGGAGGTTGGALGRWHSRFSAFVICSSSKGDGRGTSIEVTPGMGDRRSAAGLDDKRGSWFRTGSIENANVR